MKVYLSDLSRNWTHDYIEHNITSNKISCALLLPELNNGVKYSNTEPLENSSALRELLPVKALADPMKSMGSYTNYVHGNDQFSDSNK